MLSWHKALYLCLNSECTMRHFEHRHIFCKHINYVLNTFIGCLLLSTQALNNKLSLSFTFFPFSNSLLSKSWLIFENFGCFVSNWIAGMIIGFKESREALRVLVTYLFLWTQFASLFLCSKRLITCSGLRHKCKSIDNPIQKCVRVCVCACRPS